MLYHTKTDEDGTSLKYPTRSENGQCDFGFSSYDFHHIRYIDIVEVDIRSRLDTEYGDCIVAQVEAQDKVESQDNIRRQTNNTIDRTLTKNGDSFRSLRLGKQSFR